MTSQSLARAPLGVTVVEILSIAYTARQPDSLVDRVC